ncbi:MAG: glycoside hydrolase family 9 protein [Verrucomicrobiales bacterium]|nr:glycoside hydrolase family 9 protein [Verrucomicrobiales bacterium]
MTRFALALALVVGLLATGTPAATVPASSPAIRLDSVGYLPRAPKVASLATNAVRFTAVRTDNGQIALTGSPRGPVTNPDTGESLWLADFSALDQPGEYRLEADGLPPSATFRIDAQVYHEPFRVVVRGMYLWRCGTAVHGNHHGQTFAHGPCHLEDAWLDFVGQPGERVDATGGWHDAGDYNKYVVNAGVTVGAMLRAWEDFEPAVRQVPLNLPEAGQPAPEFLAELRWELDWLLKMQRADGSAYHKLSTTNFGGFILPDLEKSRRYMTPVGTAATADLVAMLAQASRVFRSVDPDRAAKYLDAAQRGRAFLRAHPEDLRPNLAGFTTGGYGTRDPDDRLWAAAELWETTGDPESLADLENRIREAQGKFDTDFDWGNVRNLGLITYLRSGKSGRDAALLGLVRSNLIATADGIVATAQRHGYGRPLGDRYYWGCNGSVARQTLPLMAAHRLTGNAAYRNTALDALHHLLGRNVFGRSTITGLGHRPPQFPHDRRSGGDNVNDPWPGYLVGGPNPGAADWNDDQKDFRTNEIAINWNGALIYALAAALAP